MSLRGSCWGGGAIKAGLAGVWMTGGVDEGDWGEGACAGAGRAQASDAAAAESRIRAARRRDRGGPAGVRGAPAF